MSMVALDRYIILFQFIASLLEQFLSNPFSTDREEMKTTVHTIVI